MATLEQRFWSKVDKSGGADACWLWTAAIDTTGYGAFKCESKKRNSHRVAYELIHGVVARNMDIMHSCDNRLCCNPRHLSAGTRLQNVQDAVLKGRNPRGEMCGTSKLSEPLVRAIRALNERGCSAAWLHKHLQLSEDTVRDVIHWTSWKHLT